MKKTLDQILKEIYAKFHLRFCVEGPTGDLRAAMFSEFLSRASEFPEREVIDWLRLKGLFPTPKASKIISGLGKVHGERVFNPDGTYTRDVPGHGKVKFGEPVH